MEFIFNASSLTKPTFETLEEYTKKRFAKVEKLLSKHKDSEHEVKVSVEKQRDLFNLTVEVFHTEHHVVKASDRDLRKAIDIAAKELKTVLGKHHEKRINISRVRDKLSKYKSRLPFA